MIDNNLPDSSRIWIYQSSRSFTQHEADLLQNIFDEFVAGWTAHSKQLIAAMEVVHNRFIIITLDETAAEATGCSIDKSVHLLKQVEKELGVELFDRQRVAYRSGDEILDFHATELEKLIASETINPDTLIFNNILSTKGDLLNNWEMPLRNTWVSNFIAVNN